MEGERELRRKKEGLGGFCVHDCLENGQIAQEIGNFCYKRLQNTTPPPPPPPPMGGHSGMVVVSCSKNGEREACQSFFSLLSTHLLYILSLPLNKHTP